MNHTPIQMEPEAGKTHQHRPHSEVNKPGRIQTAHTGINDRKARHALLPCYELTSIIFVAETMISLIERFVLHPGTRF